MRGRRAGCLFIACVSTTFGADGPPREESVPVPHLADGFEGKTLADFWLPGDHGAGLHVPGSVVLTTECARSGRQSARLTVHEGDVDRLGDDGQLVERTEIDSGRYRLLGRDVYYGFSMRLPEDFPIVPSRLVIAQVKQSDVEGSPLVGQRFQAGFHFLTIRPPGAERSGRRYGLPAITLGRWFDMVYRVKYSEGDDGRVEVWMDGRSVVRYDGPTASPRGANHFYHKVGPYRDRIEPPMTLYVDNYRVGESYEAVDPARFDAGR